MHNTQSKDNSAVLTSHRFYENRQAGDIHPLTSRTYDNGDNTSRLYRNRLSRSQPLILDDDDNDDERENTGPRAYKTC